jgi:hypothetical protein
MRLKQVKLTRKLVLLFFGWVRSPSAQRIVDVAGGQAVPSRRVPRRNIDVRTAPRWATLPWSALLIQLPAGIARTCVIWATLKFVRTLTPAECTEAAANSPAKRSARASGTAVRAGSATSMRTGQPADGALTSPQSCSWRGPLRADPVLPIANPEPAMTMAESARCPPSRAKPRVRAVGPRAAPRVVPWPQVRPCPLARPPYV